MRQVYINATVLVPTSMASAIKQNGIAFVMQDGKYVAKVGTSIIPSSNAKVKIDLEQVGILARRHIRGSRRNES